jgi:2'-5' RNA ligase
LLTLEIPEDLIARIQSVKENFAKEFNAPLANNYPHITLVKFLTSRLMEHKIVNRFNHIAMGAAPFKVELKDYGSFPTHSIYINVTTKVPIQNLVKEVKTAQSFMKAQKEFKPHFIDEPHITICRKLKPWQYEKGWLEYSNSSFTGRFIAGSMTLLRRQLNEGARYQKLKRFDFQNLPVATKQASLFGPLSPGGGT